MAQAVSQSITVTSAPLMGVWIHDPANPPETISNFPYGNIGRTEGITVQSTALNFVGRSLPVYDMGGNETHELNIDILLPTGSDEQQLVEWFRSALRQRSVLCYRDNRGRIAYGIINSLNLTDAREGTTVSFVFNTADYNEAT